MVPGWRGAAGGCITRSERSRPGNSTGKSASRNDSRVTSYPASKTTRDPQLPLAPVPGLDQPVTTSRTCAAVTSVSSSSGPRRTASSTAVQDVRPGSSAAITEYGQPGIICAWLLPRR